MPLRILTRPTGVWLYFWEANKSKEWYPRTSDKILNLNDNIFKDNYNWKLHHKELLLKKLDQEVQASQHFTQLPELIPWSNREVSQLNIQHKSEPMEKENQSFFLNQNVREFSMEENMSKSKQSLETLPWSRLRRLTPSETCISIKQRETSTPTWPLPHIVSLQRSRKSSNLVKSTLNLFTLQLFTLIESSSQIQTAHGQRKESKKEHRDKLLKSKKRNPETRTIKRDLKLWEEQQNKWKTVWTST